MDSEIVSLYDKFVNILENKYDVANNNFVSQLIKSYSVYNDISQILYELFKERFVCTNVDSLSNKSMWYEFIKYRWLIVDPYIIENIIISNIRELLQKYCSNNLDILNQNDIIILMKLINPLNEREFKYKIMKECSTKFWINDFKNKLDSNRHLLGFSNGVYDFDSACFRLTKPSDYISLTVGYDWIDYDDICISKIETIFDDIDEYFSRLMADNNMSNFLLIYFASMLYCRSIERKDIWNTTLCSGTSTFFKLIENILGNYVAYLPTTYVNCNFECNKKKIIIFNSNEESSSYDILYTLDKYYNSSIRFSQGTTCVIECQDLPIDIFNSDKINCGVNSNIRKFNERWKDSNIIQFESNFYESKHDVSLDFDKWKQPLIWLLIKKYYPIYANGIDGVIYEIYRPNKVKPIGIAYSKNIHNELNNLILSFINECAIITDDITNSWLIDAMYYNFSQWYKSLNNKSQSLLKKDFIAYFKNNRYTMNNKRIYNIICNKQSLFYC